MNGNGKGKGKGMPTSHQISRQTFPIKIQTTFKKSPGPGHNHLPRKSETTFSNSFLQLPSVFKEDIDIKNLIIKLSEYETQLENYKIKLKLYNANEYTIEKINEDFQFMKRLYKLAKEYYENYKISYEKLKRGALAAIERQKYTKDSEDSKEKIKTIILEDPEKIKIFSPEEPESPSLTRQFLEYMTSRCCCSNKSKKHGFKSKSRKKNKKSKKSKKALVGN